VSKLINSNPKKEKPKKEDNSDIPAFLRRKTK